MRTAGSTPHGLWRTKNRAHRDGFIPRLSTVPRHLPQAVAFVDVVLVLLSCPPPDGCWLAGFDRDCVIAWFRIQWNGSCCEEAES